MKFKEETTIQLKKMMRDLDYEASEYDWGSEEYEFLMEIIAMIEDEMTEFKEGQLVLYKGVNGREIGKIKRITNNNQAFVWYHSGDTAALTDLDLLQPIINDYCIQDLIDKDERK